MDRETARAAGTMDDTSRVEHAIGAATQQLPGFASMEDDIAVLFETGAVRRTANPERDLLNAYHAVASRRAGERAHGARARHASRQHHRPASGAGAGASTSRARRGSVYDDTAASYRELRGGL